MVSMTRLRDDIQDEIQRQIDSLKYDIAVLRRDMKRRGGRAFRHNRSAGEEIVDFLRDYIEHGLPDMRRSARRIRRSARDHPFASTTAAALGLLAVGVAAALLLRR